MQTTPNVLTIAGSDSSGGAGIQADIKTFTALNVYGASVITNITAQNTQGVLAIQPLSPSIVEQQLQAIISDIDLKAIKIGMLYDNDIILSIAKLLKPLSSEIPIVVDPVLISSSGTPLLKTEAQQSLENEIFSIAHLITPNLPEADRLLLLDEKQSTEISAQQKAHLLHEKYHCNVLVKGGHGTDEVLTDHLVSSSSYNTYTHNKINTNNTHGTGCTLSSAVAAYLAKGIDIVESVQRAFIFTERAIEGSSLLNVGKSYGPVNHLIYSENE
jgi:hydroxymethylpyrimidine kinase/phosphomethylpyrimidine kinase